MSLLKAVAFLAVLCGSAPVLAEEMPKPLGIPLRASVEEAAKGLGVSLQDQGINQYSSGPMFTARGDGLGVEGLRKVLLIFDKEPRLAALQMTLGKEAFERVFGHLKKQYPLKSSKLPFVGDREAIFETKDARIEVESPHLSFDMTVMYMTKGFHQTVTKALEAERRAKQQRESTKF